MGVITNYNDYDLRWSSAAIYNKTVYLAGGENNPASPIKHLYRIVRSGDDYIIQMVSPTPVNGSDIRLISALGQLFIISDNNGQFSTWSVDPEEGTYSAITTGSFPAFRRPLNIIGTENGIYIAGKYDPANQNNTIISKFTESIGWQTIYSNVSANTGKLIMNVVDGKVMMTDILSETPETTRIELNLADDSIAIVEVETADIYGIDEGFGGFCLNETNDLLKGGFDVSGTCTPFHPPVVQTVLNRFDSIQCSRKR
ncbi:MAG TPA: hypothetical protein PLZ43_06785 [bacterium]|nr:hypothetical protein [bacterium]